MMLNPHSIVAHIALTMAASAATITVFAADGKFERLEYRNPELVVDLGVGLWAWPLPMDYDGDGDMDLVVSCPDRPYGGTWFFENPGVTQPDEPKMPLFKPAVKIGAALKNAQLSIVAGQPRVLV